MQPLKIVIPGRYWDSFVYKGRLYLFGVDGDIRSLNWDNFISHFQIPEPTKIAFKCAFKRSDYLYASDVQDLLSDSEIRALMQDKFSRLSKMELHATDYMLREHGEGQQDNPLPFPHSDLELYQDKLYAGSASGLFQATCNKRTKHPVSVRPVKMWDGSVLGLSASYRALAMAAGSEGLFEFDLVEKGSPVLLNKANCLDCSWAYYSVFASSDSSGFLAEFSKSDANSEEESVRNFEQVKNAKDIFGSDGYCWGAKDKLCQAIPGMIQVVKYRPWAQDPDERIRLIGSASSSFGKNVVVSAVTANFGVVVEYGNLIVVFQSNGENIELAGEPVNWRVFPRSRHYENQLHVVYDDRLEILSFNHDYLVDQGDKLLGTLVSAGLQQSGRSANNRGVPDHLRSEIGEHLAV